MKPELNYYTSNFVDLNVWESKCRTVFFECFVLCPHFRDWFVSKKDPYVRDECQVDEVIKSLRINYNVTHPFRTFD